MSFKFLIKLSGAAKQHPKKVRVPSLETILFPVLIYKCENLLRRGSHVVQPRAASLCFTRFLWNIVKEISAKTVFRTLSFDLDTDIKITITKIFIILSTASFLVSSWLRAVEVFTCLWLVFTHIIDFELVVLDLFQTTQLAFSLIYTKRLIQRSKSSNSKSKKIRELTF